MATGIGPVTFDSVHHEGLPPSESVETFTKPGADGTAARLSGKQGRVFTIVCKKFLANGDTAFDTLIANVEALKSALQTVTYSSGRTQDHVQLIDFEVRATGDGRADENNTGPISGGVGGATGATYWAVLALRCVDASTS
ncbi:MAG: hypothetical protein ACYTAN_17245 [Planctomycetota bacterium]|jgi:hypothetical protein